MKIKTKINKKFVTFGKNKKENGHLVPIYNINENFFSNGNEPKQAYLTVVNKGCIKGPHMHKIRRGFFTCIKGNIRVILKISGQYKIFYSGEKFDYLSIEIPINVPAAIQNISDCSAYVINMPSPAWDKDMNDEFSDNFTDFDFSNFDKV